MTNQPAVADRRGSYGVDAPYALLGLACGGIGCVLAGVYVATTFGVGTAWFPFLFAVVMFMSFGLYLHATKRGKFSVWARLFDEFGPRGDERLLDLGCGRGAVLLMAARRLTTGRAVGIDLWRAIDQSGNAVRETERNAVAENVQDRVELHSGDMTSLPFEDAGFDTVVSSLAIHNIKSRAGRAAAIDEAVRMLRPGGRLLIADISAVGEYRRRLAELGMTDLHTRPLGWRMWWGGPWMRTTLVTAVKRAD